MSSRTARAVVSGSIVLSLLAGVAAVAQHTRIAVIIDDIGHEIAAGRRSIGLPGPVTLAAGRQRSYAESIGVAPTGDFAPPHGKH